MSNDIFDKLRVDADTGVVSEGTLLDDVFAQARSSEPTLLDDNFTKMVVNSLPVKPSRSQSRSILFDLIGLFLGIIAAYWFFDLSQMIQSALSLIPESLSITVANIVSLFGAAIGVACLGFWTAEKTIS